MFEGMRWFDILRYNISVQHSSADFKKTVILSANDTRRMLQIPEEAIEAGLEANPR
jgi:hypothetical protein